MMYQPNRNDACSATYCKNWQSMSWSRNLNSPQGSPTQESSVEFGEVIVMLSMFSSTQATSRQLLLRNQAFRWPTWPYATVSTGA